MRKFIDIHSHILPSVDDGAKDMEMTLQMLRTAKQQEIEQIIATPHYNPQRSRFSQEDIQRSYDQVCTLIQEKVPGIQLHLGNEVFYSYSVAEGLEKGEILTLAGSDYVLVEFRPDTDFRTMQQALSNIQMAGYLPILAHIERYAVLLKDFALAEELHEMGVHIQVNASSVTGNNGWKVKRYIARLMKYDLLDFIATDAHSDGHRAPHLKEAAQYLDKKMGTEYTDKILYDNPTKIITNEYIRS